MTLHRYASRPHYWRHIAAVTADVPPDILGVDYGHRYAQPWATARLAETAPARRRGLYVVASLDDARHTAPHPIVYVEHGAGQTYTAGARPHPSYAGGRDAALARSELVLVPGVASADRWAIAYPDTPVVAVGCPKIAPWYDRPGPPATTVAITWHWDCPLVPETRTAFWSYAPYLGDLVGRLRDAGLTVIGHGHPRAPDAVWDAWRRLDVPIVTDEADVFDRAGMLIADNTSLLYEYAALDRPVVVLDAPTYRRDVEHGLRFWSHVPGPAASTWTAAADLAIAAAADPAADRGRRAAVTRDVYALDPVTGRAVAASAITTLAAAWA